MSEGAVGVPGALAPLRVGDKRRKGARRKRGSSDADCSEAVTHSIRRKSQGASHLALPLARFLPRLLEGWAPGRGCSTSAAGTCSHLMVGLVRSEVAARGSGGTARTKCLKNPSLDLAAEGWTASFLRATFGQSLSRSSSLAHLLACSLLLLLALLRQLATAVEGGAGDAACLC